VTARHTFPKVLAVISALDADIDMYESSYVDLIGSNKGKIMDPEAVEHIKCLKRAKTIITELYEPSW